MRPTAFIDPVRGLAHHASAGAAQASPLPPSCRLRVSDCALVLRSLARSRRPSAEMPVTRRSAPPPTSPLARARQFDAAVSKSLFTQFGAARGLTRRHALATTCFSCAKRADTRRCVWC